MYLLNLSMHQINVASTKKESLNPTSLMKYNRCKKHKKILQTMGIFMLSIKRAYNQHNYGKPNAPLNFVRIKMLAQSAAPACLPCCGRYL